MVQVYTYTIFFPKSALTPISRALHLYHPQETHPGKPWRTTFFFGPSLGPILHVFHLPKNRCFWYPKQRQHKSCRRTLPNLWNSKGRRASRHNLRLSTSRVGEGNLWFGTVTSTWTFQFGCHMVPNGFNWHFLEGAGRFTQIQLFYLTNVLK